jgi:hypothetical protein
VITGVDANLENPQLVEGKYLFTLEVRTLDDIRALGGNSPEDWPVSAAGSVDRLLAVLGYPAPPRCLRVAAISPDYKPSLPEFGNEQLTGRG